MEDENTMTGQEQQKRTQNDVTQGLPDDGDVSRVDG